MKRHELPDFGDVIPNEGAYDASNETATHDPPSNTNRRSKRAWKPTTGMLESVAQEQIALPIVPICFQAMQYDNEYETFLDYENPITLMTQSDEDTMYWDQALRQPDSQAFIQAAIDEISTHEEQGHWKAIPKEEVPAGTRILDGGL
jgi:hypothetical protein